MVKGRALNSFSTASSGRRDNLPAVLRAHARWVVGWTGGNIAIWYCTGLQPQRIITTTCNTKHVQYKTSLYFALIKLAYIKLLNNNMERTWREHPNCNDLNTLIKTYGYWVINIYRETLNSRIKKHNNRTTFLWLSQHYNPRLNVHKLCGAKNKVMH